MFLTKTINFCGTVHVKSITKVALDESVSAEFLSSRNNQEGKGRQAVVRMVGGRDWEQ